VTVALSQPFHRNCRRMSPTLNSTAMGHSWAKLGEEAVGLTDVSQILTRSERDMGLSYRKKMCRDLLLFQHNART